MVVKIVLEQSDDTRWISVLLDSSPPVGSGGAAASILGRISVRRDAARPAASRTGPVDEKGPSEGP